MREKISYGIDDLGVGDVTWSGNEVASVARVALNPSSCAWRAVDSTPLLVATPAFHRVSRSFPAAFSTLPANRVHNAF